jgi:hypothetical protein
MALDQRKRQKKLAKQRAKRKSKLAEKKQARQSASSWKNFAGLEYELATRAPIFECYAAEEIFGESGIGQVIVSRLSGDLVAAGIFLVDALCLGVKDAFAFFRPVGDFRYLVSDMGTNMTLKKVEPEFAKKLIIEAIAYARSIGFEPHKDFPLPGKILQDIDETKCDTKFTFGRDGKPFFIAGPNDTEARCDQVIETLSRKLGPGNYDYMMPISPESLIYFDYEGDDDWEDDDDDDLEDDDDEDEVTRRHRAG